MAMAIDAKFAKLTIFSVYQITVNTADFEFTDCYAQDQRALSYTPARAEDLVREALHEPGIFFVSAALRFQSIFH